MCTEEITAHNHFCFLFFSFFLLTTFSDSLERNSNESFWCQRKRSDLHKQELWLNIGFCGKQVQFKNSPVAQLLTLLKNIEFTLMKVLCVFCTVSTLGLGKLRIAIRCM